MKNRKLRRTKKVSASKYYKKKNKNKSHSQKERDKQLYRKKKDEGVRINIRNVNNNNILSTLPETIDKVSQDEDDNDDVVHTAVSEALKAGRLLPRLQMDIKISASKKQDKTLDEIKKKNSKKGTKKKSEEQSPEEEKDINPLNNEDKEDKIKNDIVSDEKINHDIFSDNRKKTELNNNHISEINSRQENISDIKSETLRKRKLTDTSYDDYAEWKKLQKKRKADLNKNKKTDTEGYKDFNIKKNDETNKEKKKDSDKKKKDEELKAKYRKAKRKMKRKKRMRRAVNPLIKNAQRNIIAVGHEVKSMPVKSLRMVTDDISADELAMRTGKGIMGYMSKIYGSAMKTIGAVVKSLAILAAGVAKDILIAFAPLLAIGLLLGFMVYFIFLSPMQLLMGGSGGEGEEGEEVTTEQNGILKSYCSQALLESADNLKKKILTEYPDSDIKILTVSEENLNDMCNIISVVMALYGAYPDDEEWLKSSEGQEELNKYAGFMCHQMDQEEIDEQPGNQPEEPTTEEATTQPAAEEPSTELPTEDTEIKQIWIGYYSYEYLLNTGYLRDIEEFLQ